VPVADREPNPAVADILSRAIGLKQSQPGRIIEARNNLNDALKLPMSLQQRQAIKDEMAKLADDWLFGPAVFAGDTLCETYMVKRGDLLQVIGRKQKVPHEILMQINNIKRPEALQAGRAIKIVKGPFSAKVQRSTYTLDLYLGDMYVRSFKVGLGKPGYETPTGLWRVQENGKLIQPPWTDPDTGRLFTSADSDYPLGSRWIALDGLEGQAKDRTGFAIHGTKDPEQIGTGGSRGCIRMYNGDAVLMFNLLTPVYSRVEIVQ
jgi:lipoprotein-anchoring transpeptidase ErfK/SrfK